MQANPDKFLAIAIGPKTSKSHLTINLGNSEINCEEEVKLLGVTNILNLISTPKYLPYKKTIHLLLDVNSEIEKVKPKPNIFLKDAKLVCSELMCLKLLHEAIVSQRFKSAVSLLTIYPTKNNATDSNFYKAGLQILSNSDEENIQLRKNFCQIFLSSYQVFSKDIILDYLIAMLEKGLVDTANDAKMASNFCYRDKELPSKHPEREDFQGGKKIVSMILRGYEGLINYIYWMKKRSNAEVEEDQSQSIFHIKSVQNLLTKATNQFSTLIGEPGYWDIFVIKYLHILILENEWEEAEKMLKENIHMNPSHLNARIYLCEFLHNYNSAIEEQVKALKNLLDIDPSHNLLLCLVQKVSWIEKEKPGIIRRLFKFLDYSCNKDNETGWEELCKLLSSVLSTDDLKSYDAVLKCWKNRSDWWLSYHFSRASVVPEMTLYYKAQIATFFLKPNYPFFKQAKKVLKPEYRKLLKEHQKKLLKYKKVQFFLTNGYFPALSNKICDAVPVKYNPYCMSPTKHESLKKELFILK
ncbi:TATA box-binding protein-associated factor RNA polymerase I subunit A [Nymphon striatum]|nr:TATA box-binding protein-associated factor RNA polymerase I subunit A [Nymphon striatum]